MFESKIFQAVELLLVVAGFTLMLIARKRTHAGFVKAKSVTPLELDQGRYKTGGHRLAVGATALVTTVILIHFIIGIVR